MPPKGPTLADWTEADLAAWLANRRVQKAALPASQKLANVETTDTLTVSNNLQLSPQAIAYLNGVLGPFGGGATLLSYTQVTSNVTSTASTEATAAVVVTAPAFVPNGTSNYRVEWGFPGYTGATDPRITLHDGTSSLGVYFHDNNGNAGAFHVGSYGSREYVPTATSKTYSLRFYNGAGSSMSILAGTGVSGSVGPAFIRITKVN